MATGTDELLWTSIEEAKGGFFDVLRTTRTAQTVLQTVEPGRVAGGPNEHETSDQVAYVVEGAARVRVWVDGPEAEPVEGECPRGTLLHIPEDTRHWVQSCGEEPLVLLSVYAPAEY